MPLRFTFREVGLEPGLLFARVVAADPDLARLRMASRTTLTVALTAGLLALLAPRLGYPSMVTLMGAFIGMMSSSVVNDEGGRAQAWTHVLVPFPVAATLMLGTVLSPWNVWSGVGFVAVTFLAVLARAEGTRGTSLGLMGFMGYFYAVYLRPPREVLPWVALALGVAAGVSLFVRFVLVPESTRGLLKAQARAQQAQIRVVTRLLIDALDAGKPRFEAVRPELTRLNELTLQLEEQILKSTPEERPSALAGPDALTRVYELELGVERLAGAVRALLHRESLPEPVTAQVAESLRAVLRAMAELDDDEDAPPPDRERVIFPGVIEPLEHAKVSVPDADWATAHQVREIQSALEVISGCFTGRAIPPPPTPAPLEGRASNSSLTPPTPWGTALRTEAKRGLQAALAVALAMVSGRFVSEARWPWAVIAAYFVYNRATTVADTVQRAWHRTLGTVAGVIAGLGLAHLLAGHPTLEWVALFTCIFVGYYLLRLSYAWMMLLVTTELVLLYNLLGRYSPGLLWARVLETLIGAAAGAVVAWVVFPNHARGRVTEDLAELLAEVAAFLDELGPRGALPAYVARDRARELDRRMQLLRDAAKPFDSITVFAGSPEVSRRVRAVSRLIFYTRTLTRMLHPGPVAPTWPDALFDERLRRAAVRVRGLQARVEGQASQPDPPRLDPEVLPTPEGGAAMWEPWVAHQLLNRLNDALMELSVLLGLPPPASGAVASRPGGTVP